jgi:hypothetical protein
MMRHVVVMTRHKEKTSTHIAVNQSAITELPASSLWKVMSKISFRNLHSSNMFQNLFTGNTSSQQFPMARNVVFITIRRRVEASVHIPVKQLAIS